MLQQHQERKKKGAVAVGEAQLKSLAATQAETTAQKQELGKSWFQAYWSNRKIW